MRSHRLFVTVFCIVVAPAVLFAQGKPNNPGPPAAPAPLTVVDAAGTLVGEVFKLEDSGLARVSIKYPLPGGDYVVLQARMEGLSQFGSFPVASYFPPGPVPANAKVYFKEVDCSGDAWVNFQVAPGFSSQLTARQAIILGGLQFGAPPTPGSGACPLPVAYGENWLYAATSAAVACPIPSYPPFSPITFNAVYAFGPNGSTCAPIAGGRTFGDFATGPAGVFVPFSRIENLTAKFQPPFRIP